MGETRHVYPRHSEAGRGNRVNRAGELCAELRVHLAAGRKNRMLETAIELNRQVGELLCDCYDLAHSPAEGDAAHA